MIVETIIVGIAAGVLSGLFGVGGGAIFVPALVLVFGVAQTTAEGTSLLAMIPVAALGAWTQNRTGLVRARPALTIGLVAIVGVTAGSFLALHLPETTLRRIFSVFLLFVAWQLAKRSLGERRKRMESGSADSGQGL